MKKILLLTLVVCGMLTLMSNSECCNSGRDIEKEDLKKKLNIPCYENIPLEFTFIEIKNKML